MQANAVDGGDADGACKDVLDLLDFAVQQVVSLNHLLAVVVENLAFPGESKILPAPFDQQGFEGSFQSADLLTDGGLGNLVDLRSLCEALGFDEVTKDLKAFQLH